MARKRRRHKALNLSLTPGLSTGRRASGPQLALGSVLMQTELNSGTRTWTIPCVCSGAGDNPVSVDWVVQPVGENPANAADFGGTLPSGSLDFGLETVLLNIVFTTVGDTTWEEDETFQVALQNPVNATIVVATAQCTIVNDDAIPIPAGISDLAVASFTRTSATLTFSDVQHATGYQYRLNGGTAISLATNRVVTDLTRDTSYDLEVRAINASGQGPWSNLVSFTTEALVLGVVTGVAVDPEITSALIFFSPVTDALSYEYRLNAGSATALPENKTITGLTRGTIYDLELRAVNADVVGAWSSPVEFTTEVPVINVITDLAVSSISENSATLSFTPATNAITHEYSLNAGAAIQLAEGNVISGLTASTIYTVMVRGRDAEVIGPWSSAVQFTTSEPTVVVDYLLREDGFYMLREDGSKFIREEA